MTRDSALCLLASLSLAQLNTSPIPLHAWFAVVAALLLSPGELRAADTPANIHEHTFDTCGDYTAHVVQKDDTLSPACEFAVCDLDLRLPAGSVPLSGGWKVGFGSENMNVIAVYLWNSADSYGRHPLFLTEEQKRSGSLTIPAGLLKKAGTLQVWLIGEHKLGRLKLRKDLSLIK